MSARMTAYALLRKTEKGAYSNLALDGIFRDSTLSSADKAFAARLFFGVTERRLTLEHILSAYVSKPISKLDPEVRLTLLMGLYQIKYMDSVPDSAAVNESVSMIKALKKSSASGMVNAVLRSFIRNDRAIPPVKGGKYARAAVEYSCPEELVRRIWEGYGEENARSLLESSLVPAKCILRANTLKLDADKLSENLTQRGISAHVSDADPCAVICDDLRDIENDSDFAAGHFHVQDLSSQMCCRAVDPQAGETVIDLCAAPGGKSFTMAELMGDRGEIFSCELHEKRTGLISQGADRLGIRCIRAVTGDARVHNDSLPMADRVLCDVPCSGYGVIRGKPEIRYKPLSEADRLPEIQLDILRHGAEYVKPGGLLVYSTCTVNIEENERVAERFLAENEEFVGEAFPESMGQCFSGRFMKTVFTEDYGGDGFFICRMRRVR